MAEEDNDKSLITYLNIPTELVGNDNLSNTDEKVFALIRLKDGKKGCYANNSYFAQMLKVTTKTISFSISNLKKEGYISEINKSFDGRKRVLIVENYQKTHKQYLLDFNKRYNGKSLPDIPSNVISAPPSKVNPGRTKMLNREIQYKNTIKNSFSKEKEEPFLKASRIPSENSSPVKLMRRKPFIQKEVIQKNIPTDIEDILDYWQDMKLHMPRVDTKAYNQCVQKLRQLLSGKLFGMKYSIDTIKDVICKFSFAALDPQFEPANLTYKKTLSKMTIAQFILNPFNKNGNASLFKQYLKEPPKTLKEFTPVEDKYPTVTSLIKKTYQEKVLGTSKINYSKSDEDCFRLASNKLMEFFKNNKDNLALNLNNGDKVELLFDSILKTTNENQVTITPQWLCSQKTINTRLPSWCFKQSVFQTTSQWSMYDKPIRKSKGSSLLEQEDEDIIFPEDEDITF